MSKNLIIGGVIVILLLVGGYFLLGNTQIPKSSEENDVVDDMMEDTMMDNDNNGVMGDEMMTQNHEIVYTDTGYSPAEIRIKVGDTVTFKNQGTQQMWTASAMHPTHAVYSGTSLQQHCPDPDNNDFDQCQATSTGSSWSFTFIKAGTWAYHNHVKANHFGKVIVE